MMMVFCFMRAGPRVKRPKKPPSDSSLKSEDEKRPRTAFSGPQLARLKVRTIFGFGNDTAVTTINLFYFR